MTLDALVDKTYDALLSVVQTTALSRKVLQRPPFTFLHKLLVETLGDYDIFTYQQLEFAELVTKEDKAAFLTRAIAFVAFAMASINNKRISCLLLVSPIKVLAGVAVEDTHEFLLQLCEVCKSPDREAKDAAAQDVIAKGDAQLYTSGVSFRKGLLLIQAIVRSFIKRRAGKRKALQSGAAVAATSAPLTMAHGTRFLKELADGRVYDGVIKDVNAKVYVLGYEQDPTARDEVDEIEMKIILEESQRLSLLRERLTAKTSAADDADISLTGLPDLSLPLPELLEKTQQPSKTKLIKRVSSRDSAIVLTPKRAKPALSRSQSQRHPAESTQPPQLKSQSSFRRDKHEPSLSRLSSDGAEECLPSSASVVPSTGANSSGSTAHSSNQDTIAHEQQCRSSGGITNNSTSEQTWQTSLKKMLASGQEPESAISAGTPLSTLRKPTALEALPVDAIGSRPSSDHLLHTPHALNFPKLSIPGTTPLASVTRKRLLPHKSAFRVPSAAGMSPGPGSVGAAMNAGSKRLGKSKSQQLAAPAPSVLTTSRTTAPGARPALASIAWGSTLSSSLDHRAGAGAATGDGALLDTAFTGTYQTTDQKTQEKLTLFREIVRRIDGYMKRKHLRVIDLFRFCDADGNGSISPQEMIDTLSQMEIQLSTEQAQDFITYIDKDGNGSIDIDEFEELVRVARRNEAQREQLRKELNHPKRTSVESKPTGKFGAFVKHRQRICDEFKAADIGDVGALSVSQFRSLLVRLDLPGVDDALIDSLIDRALAVGSTASSGSSAPSSTSRATTPLLATPSSHHHPSSSSSASTATASSASNASGMVYYQQLYRSLDDLEWSKKTNRFLDQGWLAQFDAQMERAVREFELL